MGSSSEYDSGEDTDVNDSKDKEYVEKVYEELKNDKYNFKLSDIKLTLDPSAIRKKGWFSSSKTYCSMLTQSALAIR